MDVETSLSNPEESSIPWQYGDLLFRLLDAGRPANDISHNDALSIPVTFPDRFQGAACESIALRARSISPSTSNVSHAQPNARRADGHWLFPDSEWTWLYEEVGKIFLKANERFGFALMGFVDPILVAEYPEGPGFDWHIDAVTGVTSTRKLSLTVPLNPPTDFKGGRFEIAPFGENEFWQCQGAATIFPSFLCHRVTPIAAGKRLALVAWAHGPSFR